MADATTPYITQIQDLPPNLHPKVHPDALHSFREARREVLESFERAYLTMLYDTVRGDIRQACSLSNLSRARLYELLRKHSIMQ